MSRPWEPRRHSETVDPDRQELVLGRDNPECGHRPSGGSVQAGNEKTPGTLDAVKGQLLRDEVAATLSPDGFISVEIVVYFYCSNLALIT